MENERKAREEEEKEKAERMKRIKEQFNDPNSQWEKDKADIQNIAMKEKKEGEEGAKKREAEEAVKKYEEEKANAEAARQQESQQQQPNPVEVQSVIQATDKSDSNAAPKPAEGEKKEANQASKTIANFV